MDRFLGRSPLLAGLIAVWFLVIAGSLITAIVLHYTDVAEQNINYFSYTINAFALLFGGWISGRKSSRKGWYHGAITGLLYVVIVYLIGFLAFDTSLDLKSVLHVIGAMAIAAFGGMMGVNMR